LTRILTKEEIIFLNKNNISRFGGNYVAPNNLLHENSLDYLVDIIDAELFGEKMYPQIQDKASVYLFSVISNHIFTDGNKRAGLDSCLLFLDYNNYKLSESVTNPILTDFILSIASGQETLESVQNWIKINTEKRFV
jgi:death-on-curing protein